LSGFVLGFTSASFIDTFDMTSSANFNSTFITNHGGTTASAFAALVAGLSADEAYLNIPTSDFPAGEIRGFLTATPLPAALPLFATGLGGLGLLRWRRKRKAQAPRF
jgi:hypothetical protein